MALRYERVRDEQQAANGADRITLRLTLHGPLTEAQRQRLGVIASRCPIHRLLARAVQIEEILVPADT